MGGGVATGAIGKQAGRQAVSGPLPKGLQCAWVWLPPLRGPDRYKLRAIKLSPCHLRRIQSRAGKERGRRGRGRRRGGGGRGGEVSCSASHTNFLPPQSNPKHESPRPPPLLSCVPCFFFSFFSSFSFFFVFCVLHVLHPPTPCWMSRESVWGVLCVL